MGEFCGDGGVWEECESHDRRYRAVRIFIQSNMSALPDRLLEEGARLLDVLMNRRKRRRRVAGSR